MRRLPVLPLLLLLLACVEAGPAPGTGSEAATLENGRLEEVVRLGGLDGPVETTFGNVQSIRPIPGGGFHVVDGQVPIIRRYSADGTYQGDLGRGGEGPGEYQYVMGLATLNDGRTVVMDGSTMRATVFAPPGEVSHTFPLQPRGMGYRNRADPETGDIFAMLSPEQGFVEGSDVSVGDWARISLDGTVERLRAIPPQNRVGPRYVLSGAEMAYPFSIMTHSVMGPEGDYWEMRNDADSILHVHPDGTESWIRLEGERVELTPDELEQWQNRGQSMYERIADQPRPAGYPSPDRSDYLDVPTLKPYVRNMFSDVEGRLWVLRYTAPIYVPYSEEEAAERAANGWAPHNWRDELLWEVFDTDDRLIGRVVLPPKSGLYDAMGDDLYVLSLGDYREAYVSRYRVDFGEGERLLASGS